MNDATRGRSLKGLLVGLFAVAAGAAVLAGWLFEIPSLKSVLPGVVTMKANTAVGFILAGLSLALLGCAARSAWVRQLSRVCAGATALLGLLTLCQYLFGLDFGIDQLLFREAAGAVGTLSLGRMSPATAVNFLLLGCALFLAGFRRAIPAAQRLVLVTGLMGLLPLVGYVYGATALIGIGQYTQMAVHTAVLFILVSLGVLLLHPADGLMRTVTGDTVGGWLLRRLAPFVVGVPLVLGWLRVQGEQHGHFNGPLGVALMMVVLMLILTGLIAWTARALNRSDACRRQAEDKAREREAFSRSVLDAVGANIAVLDRNGVITAVNRAWQEFARNNGDTSGGSATSVSVDYLAVARAAQGASTEGVAEALAGIQNVLAGRSAEFTIEYPCHSPDERRWFMLRATPLKGEAGGAVLAHINITAWKLAEVRRELATQILATLNRGNTIAQLMKDILRLIKEETGMEAAGIRLREGDDFPYYETNGFPESFVELERHLCARDENGEIVREANGQPILECMCGNILCGRTDPALPFFTPGGSFWTNCTTELLAGTTEKDRQGRTRNRCNGAGYESVALVPLRSGDVVIGLLQLNDRRKGMFTLDKIRFFEGIGASIGIALVRRRTAEALRDSETRFRTIFEESPVAIWEEDFSGAKSRFDELRLSGVTDFRCYFDHNPDEVAALAARVRVIKVNRWSVELLGADSAAHLAKELPRYFTTDSVLVFKEEMVALAEGKRAFHAEIPILSHKGEHLLLDLTLSVPPEHAHDLTCVLVSFLNITERKRAEKQTKHYQAKLRSLTSKLAVAEERERRRIATALHDEIGQGLALIKMTIGEMLSAVPGADLAESLKTIRGMIVQMIERTRFLTFELSPPILYELGFEAAISWLAEEFQKRHGIHCEYEDNRHPKPLEVDVCVTLFQSVRELLYNVVKHARAKNVKVRVEGVGPEIRVLVEDDGIGFAADDLWSNHRNPGFGLFSIRERLESIGGHMQVESQPEHGTRVTLVAPLALNNQV
jgi:signal transduction histidine kinase